MMELNPCLRTSVFKASALEKRRHVTANVIKTGADLMQNLAVGVTTGRVPWVVFHVVMLVIVVKTD